jgi:hypothetical protein
LKKPEKEARTCAPDTAPKPAYGIFKKYSQNLYYLPHPIPDFSIQGKQTQTLPFFCEKSIFFLFFASAGEKGQRGAASVHQREEIEAL